MPPLQLGKRRYDAKQKGFGGQTKPIFHKKVAILIQMVTCRRSRPRSWCSVSSARSARPRLRDLLRDARPLRLVRRRTRTLRPIKIGDGWRIDLCFLADALLGLGYTASILGVL